MEPLQIADAIKEKFQDDVLSISEYRGQVSVTVNKSIIRDLMTYLHASGMDHLRDLTAVDYLGKRDIRFEVVYHLLSIKNRCMIRIKTPVSEADCAIDSVVPIWIGADWHERECFDLFGIRFNGHPNMTRILMPEDWVGHPLRKDYPITGPSHEDEWPGYKQVLEDAERLKEFEWNR